MMLTNFILLIIVVLLVLMMRSQHRVNVMTLGAISQQLSQAGDAMCAVRDASHDGRCDPTPLINHVQALAAATDVRAIEERRS